MTKVGIERAEPAAFTYSEPRAGLLRVTGDLRQPQARGLAELLLGRLDAQAALQVELFHVTAADLSTLQTMIVAQREARRQDKQLRFIGYGLVLSDLMEQFDLAHEVGGPLAVVWE